MTRCLFIHDYELCHCDYKIQPRNIYRKVNLTRWRNKIKAWNIRVLSDYRKRNKRYSFWN